MIIGKKKQLLLLKQKEENKIGYYTYYTMNYYSDNPEYTTHEYMTKVAKRLEDICGYAIGPDEEDINPFGCLENEPIKWYDHDEDMLILSKQFPNIWFELYGDGEDSEDRWRTLYHNGKMSYSSVIMTYEKYLNSFDEPIPDWVIS